MKSIHAYYDQLNETERKFVDGIVGRDTFKSGEQTLGYRLLGNDSCERAVDALARWVIESRNVSCPF